MTADKDNPDSGLVASSGEAVRWFPTTPEAHRSELEKDRDRIVHSSAFRRLQGKSQVFGAQTTDYFRNRLTHSLECAQIGRAIAYRSSQSNWQAVTPALCDFATVVEAACLAHDIGHPPFGHNGEEALSDAVREHLDDHLFEGNAHSFRILTFVEPKQFAEVEEGYERWLGLNLTRATLKAVQKYPWLETDDRVDRTNPKFSVFDDPDDISYHLWIWEGEEPRKTLTAEVMDVADDIAYATHDFEDGVWSGMIPIYDLVHADDSATALVHRKLVEKHPKITVDEVQVVLEELFAAAFVAGHFRPAERSWSDRPFERSRENVAYLKRLSAALIGMFIDAVTPSDAFKRPEQEIALYIDALTAVAWVWMIERSDLTTRQYGQRKIIRELFDGYVAKPDMLPRRQELADIRQRGLEPSVERGVIGRLICDHIAGMTDQYALRAHREMTRGESPFEIRYAY